MIFFAFYYRFLTNIFFLLCQQIVELIEKRGEQPLIDLLNLLGGWPLLVGDNWKGSRWTWTDTVARMKLLGVGMDYIVEVSVIPDFHNSTKRILYVSLSENYKQQYTFNFIHKTANILAFLY